MGAKGGEEKAVAKKERKGKAGKGGGKAAKQEDRMPLPDAIYKPTAEWDEEDFKAMQQGAALAVARLGGAKGGGKAAKEAGAKEAGAKEAGAKEEERKGKAGKGGRRNPPRGGNPLEGHPLGDLYAHCLREGNFQ